jgi:hypothetical protein
MNLKKDAPYTSLSNIFLLFMLFYFCNIYKLLYLFLFGFILSPYFNKLRISIKVNFTPIYYYYFFKDLDYHRLIFN